MIIKERYLNPTQGLEHTLTAEKLYSINFNEILFKFEMFIIACLLCLFFSCNALNAIPLKCVSMNNQECRTRPEIININSNEPTFYPNSIEVNKCEGSCSNTNDPYAKLCVPDVVKNINITVFNLISRANERRRKCRKRLIDKLFEECNENIDGYEIIYNDTLNDYGKICNSCTVSIVLLAIFVIMRISIRSVFIHFYWYLQDDIVKQQFIKHINEKYQRN